MAGEGSFIAGPAGRRFANGAPRLRFRFQVAMAARDRPLLIALQTFLGVGSIRDHTPDALRLPVCTYTVNSHRAHHAVTIPFAETFLLPCAKRAQFESWRTELDEYERFHPTRWGKGPSACSALGCDKPVRGRGLCRSHYYRATGY